MKPQPKNYKTDYLAKKQTVAATTIVAVADAVVTKNGRFSNKQIKIMASEELEHNIYEFALNYNKCRKFVAMVCGAEYENMKICHESGLLIEEQDFYLKLKTKLLTFGNIGDKIDGASIGCCAEVNASNEIYKNYNIELNEISLSKAYRPKTMQEREKCIVCKDTFY